MQRFYFTSPLTIDLTLTDESIVHQLTRVLRVSIGDSIILFDGDGSETRYEIESISKKSIALRGKERRFPDTESKKFITLYQSLPNKIEKIEYLLQKGVEVGIRKFIFFRSDHSQKLILSESKKNRFEMIAREALEQCGGVRLPEIEFRDAFEVQNCEDTNIVLDTTGKSLRFGELSTSNDISLWVGPEGGWSEGERLKMRDNRFIFARFSERVLRTETAGIVTAFSLIHT